MVRERIVFPCLFKRKRPTWDAGARGALHKGQTNFPVSAASGGKTFREFLKLIMPVRWRARILCSLKQQIYTLPISWKGYCFQIHLPFLSPLHHAASQLWKFSTFMRSAELSELLQHLIFHIGAYFSVTIGLNCPVYEFKHA